MFNWLYIPLFLGLASSMLPGEEDQTPWLDLLREHRESHPEAQAQDLYKFLYQAVMGPGHMITDKEAARGYLYKEIEGLASHSAAEGGRTPPPQDPGPGSDSGSASGFSARTKQPAESLLEPLDPEGRVLRVNLRPFLARGGQPDSLLEAFVRSARAFDLDQARVRLVDFWSRLSPSMIRAGLVGEAPMKALESELRDHGYPPVHHSPPYARAYRPAYRVVLRSELAAACPWIF